MEREQIKEELINRYKYIYENATCILAPLMYQQTEDERDRLNEQYRKESENHPFISNDLLIYLKGLPQELLLDLESFLLSDIPFNQSKLYVELEEKKKNPEFLTQVKRGLELLEYDNSRYSCFQTKLDSWKLYNIVRSFINEQSGDLKNKEKKLSALDEYFRINRYKNDGKLWTSGFSFNFKDMKNCLNYSAVMSKYERAPRRDKKDIGLRKSDFVSYIANQDNHYEYNFSILTEEEKQQIYLTYHDELPCDLEISCDLEEYNSSVSESRLTRPDHTEPCGESFCINEDKIFVNPNSIVYRYFQVCPHCGYMVNIPNEILSEGVKKRIEERCSKDPYLFRKMQLYSELFSLEKSSIDGQIKLIRNI